MLAHWSAHLRRRLPPSILPLLLARVLVIAASFVWLVLAPPGVASPSLLAAVLATFAVYGLALLASAWRRPDAVARWNVPVLAADVLFALAVIHLSGGMRSVFFLALYVIAAFQAYYYGLRQGVVVAIVLTGLYVLVVWATLDATRVADLVLRSGFLLLTGLGLGIVGRLQADERRETTALTEALRARDRFVGDVLASVQDGVVVLDADRRVSTWNRAMEAMSGTAAEAALGRPLEVVAPWLTQTRLGGEIERVWTGGTSGFVLEHLEAVTPAGVARVLRVRGSGVRAADGAVQGVTLFLDDVTQRVGLERSLRQTERLASLGTLAGGLAHEVNNPISVIASRVELLLEEAEALGLPPQAREDLRVIHGHARRVAGITHGLLRFSRERGGDRVRVDLNQVVEETLALFAVQARLDGIAIRTRLEERLPAVQGDPVLLGQVLLDLIANAREALRAQGGEIAVETAADPEGVRLTVRDTGPGIPPDQLARIFEPFFTTRPDGRGLGLAVCYGIVRDHGRRIEVDSRPGAGTAVVVRLPGGARDGGP